MGQASSKKLTPRQVKVVKAKIKAQLEDKTITEVAPAVFPNQTPEAARVSMHRELQNATVQEVLQQTMAERGLTAESLVGVVKDGMEANRVVQIEGDFYETEVADHSIRLKAAGMAAAWMGIGKLNDSGSVNYNFVNVTGAQKDNYTF